MDAFLITGGAGFIGSHLADALLAAGQRVRVLDDLSTGKRAHLDRRCELVLGDVADPAVLRAAMAGVAGCFHLAAIASVARGNADWRGTHRINQGGSIAVFEAARDAGRLPVVYASSAAVYGDLGGAVAREDAACAPRTAYGADKLGSELHARVAWLVHGVPTLGLRFFNVYGPRQDPSSPYSGVVSIFAARLARGDGLTLHGDGSQTRDFVHVGDVVAHLRAAMAHLRAAGGSRVLNVCTGRETSVRALAGTLAALFGVTPALAHGPARPGDIARSLGDPARAVATLGVTAATRLEDGVAAMRDDLTGQ
ncbi:MAG: NAD-dependent epimerase/dehydratase family protein [Rhodospirillales bacterium]|nr:NAD-dependent epimerase/dehydratase family protein [Rhodospirillales bacterium]